MDQLFTVQDKLSSQYNLIKQSSPSRHVRQDEKVTSSDAELVLNLYNASGTPEYVNNRLIISSLCPFNNIPHIDEDILENVISPKSEYPIIPRLSREVYIKQWLNIFYYNSNFRESCLVDLPVELFDVALPSLGIKNNPKFNKVRRDMLYYLKKLQKMVKERHGIKKLSINSAYRSPEYNAMIGEVDFDSHIIGCAVDIQGNPAMLDAIEKYATAIGFGGIGRGSNFIHLDLNTRGTWRY